MGKGRSTRSRSTSSSRSRYDKPKDRSSTQTKSNMFASESSPELLHQLGRAVLSYSMRRLSGQGKSPASKPESKEREKPSSRSKSRDERDRSRDRDRDMDRDYRSSSRRSRSRARSPSRTRQRDRDRDRDSSPYQSRDRAPAPAGTTRSDSNDLHHLLGQVAVGLFGYGIRQYLHHRKVSKQQAAIARPPRRRPGDVLTGPNPNSQGQRTRGFRGWGFGSSSGKDKQPSTDRVAGPELAAALESITADLEGTSKAIRKLAGRPPAHKCDLHGRLRDEADEIQAGIERVQTSVNNVRNLHGGLRNAGDRDGVALPPPGYGLAGGGGGNDKRKVRKERGLQREESDGGRSRTRGAGSYGHRGSRRGRGEDGDRKRGLEDTGYRHSSRLYSTRDRHREERRR